MNLLEFLVTYLAIGSAFAMRAYFRNRHRPWMSVFRAVVSELVIWLPKWVTLSVRRLLSSPAAAPTRSGRRPASAELRHETLIDNLIESLYSPASGKRVRETAEMYVALQTAIEAGEANSTPTGQFELFEIAGHLNGRAGSACLFRKNLDKIRRHSRRAAEDLVTLLNGREHMPSIEKASSCLIDLFREFDDVDSIAKAARLRVQPSPERRTLSKDLPSEAIGTSL